MLKINREEYEVLKGLDDKWKWIAKIRGMGLVAFDIAPKKYGNSKDWAYARSSQRKELDRNLLQFVEYDDDYPYSIAELIEEYEIETGMRYDFGKIKVVDIDTSKLATRNGYIYVKESEEKEVKDLQWLKRSIDKRIKTIESDDITFVGSEYYDEGYIDGMRDVLYRINQLDEPETLSEEWIQEHSYNVHLLGTPDVTTVAVPREDLQNLLVPKQEEVDQAYKDGYETGKQHILYKGYLEGLEDKGSEPETVADVVTTFWKSYERLKEVMSMEVEELEEC